jgi:hypothetical protein
MNIPGKHQMLPFYFIAKLLSILRSFLSKLNINLYPGTIVLYEQFQNLWILPALYVTAELNIAEFLREKPKSIEELAAETGSHTESLYRIMRALASSGIFKETKNRYFALTPRSKALLNNDNDSLRYVLIHHLGIPNWNVLGNLIHAVRTGEDVFTKVNGEPIYDYLLHHPLQSEVFTKSMSNLSGLSLMPILQAYNFSSFKTIADIGGGEGLLLASILKKYQKPTGILFDLPAEVQKSSEIFRKYGVSDRITTVQGNFFESIPIRADVYILKNILHNWNDEMCIRILEKIKESMLSDGRILIIEMVVLSSDFDPLPKILDIQMLAAVAGGKERTKREFSDMVSKSGLHLKKFIPTIAPLHIIEVTQR